MAPRFARHFSAVPTRSLATTASALLTASLILPTSTQAQRSAESVSVDLSVLDSIGTPQNVPQLLRAGVRTPLISNAHRTGVIQNRVNRFTTATSRDGGFKLKPPSSIKRSTALRIAPAKKMKVRGPRKPIALYATRQAAPKIMAKPLNMSQPVAAPPPAPPSITAARPAPIAPTQTTALTTPASQRGKLSTGQQFQLLFSAGAAVVENAAGTQLDKIATALKVDKTLRLQLLAYSGGSAQTPSQARRMSLSRALAVRTRLIEGGILSTRIDVRALGNKSEGGPPDRVDLIITKR